LTISEQQSTWKRIRTHHKDNNGIIQLKSSNNLPILLVHIPNAHIGSANASQRTIRARSKVIQQITLTSSSPSNSTPAQKQQHNAAQINAVCQRLYIHVTHKLSVHDMLSLDKLTYLPYNLIRTIRSFLNHHNLPIFPSEYTMRKQTKQLACFYDIGTFTIDDTIISFCRISDISSLLNTTISSLFTNQQLMHYPNMPYNQIQIQTQTDKGADITKLSVQILNQAVINSVKHVLPVACYEGTRSFHALCFLYDHFVYTCAQSDFLLLCVEGWRGRGMRVR
jgi:hypothetical protein